MSFTYPEATLALKRVAERYLKLMRPMHGVSVYVRTDVNAPTASVLWSTYDVRITLPAKPATYRMPQADFDDLVAYMLHEIGHPTHTDKTAWENACKQGLASLTNALEDVRMERAVIASGIVPNALPVLSRLISRKMAEARADGWRPNARKSIGWTLAVLGRAANGYAVDTAWVHSQIVPGSTVAKVVAWALPALAACQSTDECRVLAEKIAAAMKQPATGSSEASEGEGEGEASEGKGEASEGKGEASEGNGTGKGEASEGEGEGEASEGEGEASEGESEGEASEGEGEASEGEGEGEGEASAARGGNGHGDGSQGNAEAGDEKPVLTNADFDDVTLAPSNPTPNSKSHTDTITNDMLSRALSSASPLPVASESTNANAAPLQATTAKASKQRALLARALRAEEYDERETGKRSGRLDRSALPSAFAGVPTVFEKREVNEGFDTDVTILIDASGSMQHRIGTAAEIALIVAQAAASVGAAHTTELFNGNGTHAIGKPGSKQTPRARAFARMLSMPQGGTPLSPNIARSAIAQAKRAPQKRRVLFIITDGQCDYGSPTVRAVARYCEQAYGTVFAHVSIDTALEKAFAAEVRVSSADGLAAVKGLEHFTATLQRL